MRAVVFTGAGGNEVIDVQNRPDPTPGGDELLVRQRYAALNPADVQQRRGLYPAPPGSPPDVPGLEVCGEVVAVGPRATRFAVGDRVFGIVGGGGLADLVLVSERHVSPVPETLDDADAAAVPESYITANDAVMVQAGLRSGEVILVHGASGGVGSAAVQLALATGARPIAVVRSEEAAARFAALGVPAVPDDAFPDAALDLTDGRGADVIVELVGAPHFPGNIDAAALKGRIVCVSAGAGSESLLPLQRLMVKRLTLIGTVLRARPAEEKGLAVRAFERTALPHLAAGAMRPAVQRILPMEAAGEALDLLTTPGRTGKILLEVGP